MKEEFSQMIRALMTGLNLKLLWPPPKSVGVAKGVPTQAEFFGSMSMNAFT